MGSCYRYTCSLLSFLGPTPLILLLLSGVGTPNLTKLIPLFLALPWSGARGTLKDILTSRMFQAVFYSCCCVMYVQSQWWYCSTACWPLSRDEYDWLRRSEVLWHLCGTCSVWNWRQSTIPKLSIRVKCTTVHRFKGSSTPPIHELRASWKA